MPDNIPPHRVEFYRLGQDVLTFLDHLPKHLATIDGPHARLIGELALSLGKLLSWHSSKMDGTWFRPFHRRIPEKPDSVWLLGRQLQEVGIHLMELPRPLLPENQLPTCTARLLLEVESLRQLVRLHVATKTEADSKGGGQ